MHSRGFRVGWFCLFLCNMWNKWCSDATSLPGRRKYDDLTIASEVVQKACFSFCSVFQLKTSAKFSLNWFVVFTWIGKKTCLFLLSEHAQAVRGFADLTEICIPLQNMGHMKQKIMRYIIFFRIFWLSLLNMKTMG